MRRRRSTIRDHHAESALFGRRVVVALVIVVAVFGVLLGNMYQLQVTEFQSFQTRSNDNRIKVVPLAPNRGIIYDAKGRILAENRPVLSLEVIPERVQDLEATVARLAALLDISVDELERFERNRKRERRFEQVILLDQLNEHQAAIFAARQHEFPGVSIEARLVRHYPYGESLTHALGYVAKINQRDAQRLKEQGLAANYAATRTIGKLGIEGYYEEQLHGAVGYQQVEVDIHGRSIRTLAIEPPIPGQDLVLEIDIALQQKAQQILGTTRGSIVVMDPRDGAVRAMVSQPSYDPNWFAQGISVAQYRGLLDSIHSPLLNRATQGGYPPASTIKPQLAIVGLEEQTITTDTQIWDPGWFQIKGVNHRYRDWLSWGHGWVNVDTAIVESCDTFFYDLALKLGIDTISEHMVGYGFGERTGIDIGEESAAVMPSRGWKRARFNQPWYAGETVSIGIGQSYWTVTPMQLAVATAVVVNKGTRPVPRLLRSIRDAGIELPAVHEQREPVQLNNPAHWNVALSAMEDVVSGTKGTARTAFRGAPYSSGGKTGTAQVRSIAQDEEYDAEAIAEKYRDNAMYVGYAPADEPEMVIVITAENVMGGGGSVAAPMARELMDFYFKDDTAVVDNAP
ncbi:penicillin-binding protein 2 [Pseudidiomarina terrestris]|uniref:Peptidoglycan D,D-transpeptidase MrdA n=1 Tax=Pseudidiomarina terrestris TaxID=2820060 RepID=A0AAW7QWB5_9GAMM|nr:MULTISPECIES: penicillin-binding protein 2 [unclassified Pseudidiomarina]MDN7123339.1 penicillin-binding protein 2 [Pseudidiomarina sp. 1APP75-32.1]MDN7127829.1 penicillin-binding protein 2 [Pseudidiomarina sp. 1APR75-33.1]MDN7128936.1 penicillin-binding protein 2 [Pseudidiomarina sp. 1APR75-15]MDN7134801.1 penicillin-binding protein 2 [Pseudidiomarina sp. 1ASP75-5]MDN7137479.1 penicillin-binding protein 2 [Pseudidiomarina sp. 1ASP75-14]